jgi:hypothetical protein
MRAKYARAGVLGEVLVARIRRASDRVAAADPVTVMPAARVRRRAVLLGLRKGNRDDNAPRAHCGYGPLRS